MEPVVLINSVVSIVGSIIRRSVSSSMPVAPALSLPNVGISNSQTNIATRPTKVPAERRK